MQAVVRSLGRLAALVAVEDGRKAPGLDARQAGGPGLVLVRQQLTQDDVAVLSTRHMASLHELSVRR